MQHILALDQGTTSSRAIVFDEHGRIRASAQREFTQIFPRPAGWSTTRNEIWSSQAGVAAEALARAGLTAQDVAAIGITNQRETAVVWDRGSGQPICNAIVWQDRRTAPSSATGCRPRATRRSASARTGLLIDPYFSATKVAWILDNVPGARDKRRARRAGVRHGRLLADLEAHRAAPRTSPT